MALFDEMKEEGVPYNTITYNSIIDVCIKCGEVRRAEDLVKQMNEPENNVEPDLITYSTLLKGYCHTGEMDKALQVSETIKERGLRRDELVYNTLMDGCVKANDISTGVGLFEEMLQASMKPSAITHSILVRLYKRAGYEQHAVEAVAQLYHHHGLEWPYGGGPGRSQGRGDRDKARSPNNNALRERGGLRRKGGASSPQGTSPPPSPMPSPTPSLTGCGNGNGNPLHCHGWGAAAGRFHTGPSEGEAVVPDMQGSCQGTPMAGLYLPVEAMRIPMPPFPVSGAETPGSGTSAGTCTPVGTWQMAGLQCCGGPGDGSMQVRGPMQAVCVPPFPVSGASTPGSCTPGSCTPGGAWFGIPTGAGGGGESGPHGERSSPAQCSLMESPMGQAVLQPDSQLPPWPPESSNSGCSRLIPSFHTNTTPMGMTVPAASMGVPQETAVLPSPPLPSEETPRCGGQVGADGGNLPASPDRNRCPGTPEQYASYPMPQAPLQNDAPHPLAEVMPQAYPMGGPHDVPYGMPVAPHDGTGQWHCAPSGGDSMQQSHCPGAFAVSMPGQMQQLQQQPNGVWNGNLFVEVQQMPNTFMGAQMPC